MTVRNLIAGTWTASGRPAAPIYDPATGEVIEEVPICGAAEVDETVAAAAAAAASWAATPLMDRTALMFKFKALLEAHAEELAEIVTRHHGKTLEEARGEVRRGIDVVDFACGAPTLLQGRTLRQVGRDVDQDYYRFPLGVVAGITPFNFPVMIPLWMFPLAIAAGNVFVLKPSERTPLGVVRLAELFAEAGFPPGVLNVVHGAREVVERLCQHPDVAAVSFVGSEPIAKLVYEMASAHGKRVQAAGGAKNHLVVMPDADLSTAVPAILGSAFGNAGERCLAGSVAVAVGDGHEALMEAIGEGAQRLVVGPGDQPGVDVGPLVNGEHRDRVVDFLERGLTEGASLIVDGRREIGRKGFFLGPTILDGVASDMVVGRDEIFGPVLSVSQAGSLEEAIDQANRSAFGNMAAVFTTSGHTARAFREHVEAGMVGVNVGVAQPFAFFPFSGWRGSFYGDLHIQGTDGVDFYTRKKMVVTRW